MMTSCNWMKTRFFAVGLAVLMAFPSLAWAQDDADLGWSDTAELTVVFTGGNAEASTLGFNNRLDRTWENAQFRVDVGTVRAESTQFIRTATGPSPSSFVVSKDSVTAVTAESYVARMRYERNLSDRLFWYAGTGWDRNTFAGIQNRHSLIGGVGTLWFDDDRTTFSTAYGLSATRQEDVSAPGETDSFAGLRLSYDYRLQVTPNTEFTSVFVADENLNDTGDFRADIVNAIAVSMSSQLALKVSWQALYDKQPSLIGLPLQGIDGTPSGATVFTALNRTDNLITLALVASF